MKQKTVHLSIRLTEDEKKILIDCARGPMFRGNISAYCAYRIFNKKEKRNGNTQQDHR